MTGAVTRTRCCSVCGLTLPVSEFYPVKEKTGWVGLQAHCKKCGKATSMASRVANRQHVNEQARAYRKSNPDRYKEINKRAYDKKINALPPLLLLIWRKEQTARMAAWRKQHTTQYTEWQRRRMRHVRAKDTDVTAEALDRMLVDYDFRCGYCYRPVDPKASDKRDRPTYDHMTAMSRGGKHMLNNLCIACWYCNSKKHDRSALEFLWGRDMHLGISTNGLKNSVDDYQGR